MTIKTLKQHHIIKISLGIILILLIFLPAPQSMAASHCSIGTASASGTATAKSKAQRNAKISLMAQLRKQYPGEAKSRMRGPVGYACKKPLLWRCRATVKICR